MVDDPYELPKMHLAGPGIVQFEHDTDNNTTADSISIEQKIEGKYNQRATSKNKSSPFLVGVIILIPGVMGGISISSFFHPFFFPFLRAS